MEILGLILAALLIYNNSLVLLGPTTWGTGIGPKKAYVAAVTGQLLGVATSTMPQLGLDPAEFLYIFLIYAVLTYIKISLPIAVSTYAMDRITAEAVAFWLLSPIFAAATYLFCRILRKETWLSLPTLFVVMYMFGHNNVALLTRDLAYAAPAILIGTYIGLKFSRWVLELAALRTRTAISTNLTLIVGSLMATSLKIPVSFTLVAYSSLFATSYMYRIRVIKAEKFLKSYLGILAAVAAAAIFPYLKSLLGH